jgi:lipopolysaccharide export system protein LptC
LTAAEGESVEQGRLLRLTGGVRIYREGAEAAEIVTDNVEIRPEQGYAETAAPVTLNSAQGRVQAVGMQAFLEEERIILRSQVRGTYDVP